jgi:hypothetical protein
MTGAWRVAREPHRVELRDGRLVDVLAFTVAGETPGRYRVRDSAGGVFVVSADDVVGEVEPLRP